MMPWSLCYAIHIQGHWWVAFDHPADKSFTVVAGPLKSREEAFVKMATLRGQVVNGVELK